jgi:hypothetical protein
MKQGTDKLRVLGYEQLASIASSTAPSSVPAGTVAFAMQCSGQAVRWRADGGTPTASVGMRLLVTEPPQIFPFSPHSLRVIQESATGVVNLTYFGE